MKLQDVLGVSRKETTGNNQRVINKKLMKSLVIVSLSQHENVFNKIIVGFLYQVLCLECDIRHIREVMTKNMTKMTNSGTKGESLTKKHDIRRTAGERRGTEVYELSFGSIKKETVRLSKLNASIRYHSECIREGAKRATSSA